MVGKAGRSIWSPKRLLIDLVGRANHTRYSHQQYILRNLITITVEILTVKAFLFFITTVLVCWISQSVVALESVTIDVSVTQDPIDPSSYTAYLLDPTGGLELADVVDSQFKPLESNGINFGFTTDKIWLLFTVHNASNEAIAPILRTSARFMRPLEIFIRRSDGRSEQLLYNDETQAFGERPLPELRFLATNVELGAFEEAEIFIRFGAGGQATMALEIGSREHALAEQFRASIGVTVFAIILLTLILVNFFHFLAVRKLAYLVYVFYEAFNVLYIAHLEGFTFQYLWPNLPAWNDDATPTIAALGLLIGNIFAMVFLETRKYAPFLHKVFLVILAISGVTLVTTLLFGNWIGNQITAPLLPLSLLISVIAAALALKRGHYLARYFVAAWSLFAVVGVIWSGTILGIFTASYNVLTIYKIALATQAIILSMGLADQVRRMNNEYTRTQGELIENLEGRLEDTRERLQLEHENENAMLQLLQKSKQLATTSHDINQPIQSLRLALVALQRKSGPEVTAHLEKTLDHMESVLGGALDVASDDLKKSTEQSAVKSLVVGSLIGDVVSQFAQQAVQKSLTLRKFDSKAIIVTRELPLKRCLMNLVSNALNNTVVGGVLVGVRRRGNELLFQVIDTGTGIPQKDIDSILEPLHKGIESVGHGLGLAIVSEICSEYNWKFIINSEERSGSCFTVIVPVN